MYNLAQSLRETYGREVYEHKRTDVQGMDYDISGSVFSVPDSSQVHPATPALIQTRREALAASRATTWAQNEAILAGVMDNEEINDSNLQSDSEDETDGESGDVALDIEPGK